MNKPKTTFMTDAAGNQVPASYVSKYDKARNRSVNKILTLWKKERNNLEQLMLTTLAEFDHLQTMRENEQGIPVAEKGNFTVSSFDGLTRMTYRQNYTLIFDDRVKTAQKIMRDYALGVTKKVEDNGAQFLLSQFVDQAFEVTNKGTISRARAMQLTKLKINAPDWQKAREMLLEALNSEKAKAYILVESRASTQHPWKSITLSIADCWPEVE